MRFFAFYRVRGESMEPYAREGDFVFVRRFFPGEKPRANDVVVARDPREASRLLLKRVVGIENEGYVIRGDNAEESTDSRTFGSVPAVEGKIVARIRA